MSVRTSLSTHGIHAENRLRTVLAAGSASSTLTCAVDAKLPSETAGVNDWIDMDQALLKQLDAAIAQQNALDAQEVAAQQQQQLEQRVWWDWVQAMREGHVSMPSDWKDPGYANPYLNRETGAVLTRAMVQRAERLELVQRYMPTLVELRRAVMATHIVFLYLDARSDASDAWALSWNAGDVNYVPYNHFGAINFMGSNEKMIQEAVELMVPLADRLNTPWLLSAEETRFLQNWIVAREMLSKLDELNTHARVWADMREEYGEWSDPRER